MLTLRIKITALMLFNVCICYFKTYNHFESYSKFFFNLLFETTLSKMGERERVEYAAMRSKAINNFYLISIRFSFWLFSECPETDLPNSYDKFEVIVEVLC